MHAHLSWHTHCYLCACFAQLPISLPEGRHSHAAVKDVNDVLIIGGLGLNLKHVNTCLRLHHDYDSGSWSSGNFHLAFHISTR